MHQTRPWLFLLLVTIQIVYVCSQCSYEQDDYKVEWRHDPETDQMHFTLTHRVQHTRGDFWTGLGFGSSMADLDAIIVAVRGSTIDVTDRHARFYGPPALDAQQNVQVISRRFADGQVKVEFARAVNTGDWQDKPIDGCPFLVFPTAGGSLSSTGQLQKHHRTPLRQKLCDMAKQCQSSNTAQRPAVVMNTNTPTQNQRPNIHAQVDPSVPQQTRTPLPEYPHLVTNGALKRPPVGAGLRMQQPPQPHRFRTSSKMMTMMHASTFSPNKQSTDPSKFANAKIQKTRLRETIDEVKSAKLVQQAKLANMGEGEEEEREQQLDNIDRIKQVVAVHDTSKCNASTNRPWCEEYVAKLLVWWRRFKRATQQNISECVLLKAVKSMCCDEFVRRQCDLE